MISDLHRLTLPSTPSASTYEKAREAMRRTSAGICVHCGLRPAAEESIDCAQCDRENR